MVYLCPWQPEGWALYEMKGTQSWETGHICFDVFVLHKGRWQPLNMSTHDAPGRLSASGHFTLLSLCRIVTFQKASNIPNENVSASSPYPHSRSDFSKSFDVMLCFFIPLKYETCQFLLREMCMTTVCCRQLQLDSVSRISLWYENGLQQWLPTT